MRVHRKTSEVARDNLEFLEAINDPSHEEHHQMLEWCGGSFDPDAFDLDAVNQRLSEIKL